MRDVYVAGVGMTPFAKYKEVDLIELGQRATVAAIKDAQIDKEDIQIAYCGHARSGQLVGRESGVGQAILWRLGIEGIPVTSVSNFCASGGSAFQEAYLAVASGKYEVAIAIGAEKMSARPEKGKPLTSDGLEMLSSLGFTPPACYAQIAVRYMHEYGATAEDFAHVTVKNRGNAVMNPYAQYRKAVTLEEVMNSKMIVEPLTMLNCCPTGDGAAAAILCSKDYMKKRQMKQVVKVAGIGLRTGITESFTDLLDIKSEKLAAHDAYEMAGVGPKDVDTAEVHDAFTPGEVVHYENLGFCERGEGIHFLKSGKSGITGETAVNPSGGLLAKGHPLGATGVAQIAELVWQLRGEATGRQVENARVGLAHVSGGFPESIHLGEAQVTSVIILKKS